MKSGAFLIWAASGIFIACSPSNSDTNSAFTQDGLCTEYAANFCKRLAECSPLRMKTTFESEGACETRMKPVCVSLLQAPGSGLSPTAAEGCAKSYASADCEQLTVFGFRPAACQVKGTMANGVPCGDGSQCKSGYCTMDYFTVCGVCADPVPEGGQCSKSGQCESGLGCTGTCTVLAKQGESCAQLPCGPGLKCISAICSATLKAGAACDPASDNCDVQLGFQCDSASQKCVEFATAPLGASCSNNEACLASGHCNYDSALCEPPARDGGACDSNSACQFPAQCVNRVCMLPMAAACY